jgi:hypothetical protein
LCHHPNKQIQVMMADPSQAYGGGAPYNNEAGAGAYGGAYAGGSSYSYGGSSYPSYDSSASASGASSGAGNAAAGGGLRHRGGAQSDFNAGNGNDYGDDGKGYNKGNNRAAVVQKLDFMFPKVDKEFTVHTKGGGVASLIAYGLIAILCLAEIATWMSQNGEELTQTHVDTSLGKKMRVNINITFPALACDDMHLDAIDVAGDSQIDVEDTLKKRKMHQSGKLFSKDEIDVDTNFHRDQQTQKERILKEALPEDYCGPCYGAGEDDHKCCQTCDDVILSYTKKRWKSDLLKYTAEQCVREGRDRTEPKKMTKGQGCNLAGYMTVNRVSGNFHIAMGEGIERDGRHIHTYIPEDAPNFNASHIIHELSFGPEDGTAPLKGATKIVTDKTGTTGLFQYFIKIVPTTYVGKEAHSKIMTTELPSTYEDAGVETNRYFVTERFMPLMTELLEDHHMEKDDPKRAAVSAGGGGNHADVEHHFKQNAVLPGVFFIYEIYPFAIELSIQKVPLTHLLIRLMATVGGVFTIVRWVDGCIYARGSKNNR